MDTIFFIEVNSKGHAATSLPEAIELFRNLPNWREVDEAEYEQLVGITALYDDWVDLDKVVAEVFEIAKATLGAQNEGLKPDLETALHRIHDLVAATPV